ncbi:MAG: heparan N-sulfatase, partial [Acidobacteriota bacterium]
GERNWHNCDEHMRYVRGARFKLIRNAYTELPFGNPADLSMSPSWYSLMDKKEKGELNREQQRHFIVPRPAVEFYDLGNDPGEFNNLAGAAEYADEVKKHGTVLDKWMEETGDFPPWKRRRGDNTCRITGVKFTMEIPEMRVN